MDQEWKEEPVGRDATKNTSSGKNTCFADPHQRAEQGASLKVPKTGV